MASVEFRQISKVFPGDIQAVKNLWLKVEDGEFLVFVGPSGCGKSTVLRMLAGLEEPTGGEILIDGQIVNALSPQQRNVAMVFQNYALYPHMTVRKNIEFPLKMRRLPKNEIDQRVMKSAELLGLTQLLDRKPKQLSGGQRQRVAMGRAIVRDPAVFLMDEPLSNLDAKLRVQIRGDIAALQRRLGATTIYVTHDQVEAMTLGQRVAVLRDGVLQQAASPQEIFERPANVFVAGFIGSPGMNVFRSRLREDGDGIRLDIGPQWLLLDKELVVAHGALKRYLDRLILAGLRPEAFAPAGADGRDRERCLSAEVKGIESLGHEAIVYFTAPVRKVETDAPPGHTGDRPAPDTNTFAARLPSAKGLQVGSTVTLAVDTRRLYFFDPDGKAI